MSLRLCLIGHPVEHSLSPPLHRAALTFFGLEGSYELVDLEPDSVSSFVWQAAQKGYAGFNVTIPYKESIFTLISTDDGCTCSPEANLLAAVNTVRIDSAGNLHGHNTDLGGFIAALKQMDTGAESLLERGPALVLGAGGAARACVAGLFLMGAREVYVAARGVSRVEQICRELSNRLSTYLNRGCPLSVIRFSELAKIEGRQFSLLVNCTPVGLLDDEMPEWTNALFACSLSNAILFDIVYKRDRSQTLLMRLAAARGLKTTDGLPMLVEQAALAFEFWSGRRIKTKLMYKALE